MRKIILAILICASAGVWGQQTAPPPAQQVPSSVRIVAPKPGDKLVNNFVEVRYEAAGQASAQGSPQFRLRLDGRDPVLTTATSQTFTGLTPGNHTITVEMVDANGTPIMGSLSQIQFSVVTGESKPNRLPGKTSRLKDAGGEVREAAWMDATDRDELPQSGSALPLLSVIGLGVLIGGLASALKVTRTSG